MTTIDYQAFMAEFIPPAGKCNLVDLPAERGPKAEDSPVDLRTPIGAYSCWQDSEDIPLPVDYLDLASLYMCVDDDGNISD